MRAIARVILGLSLVFAGVGHLSFSRAEFQAQVPVWLPLDADFVVLASGIVEILLGLGLLAFGRVVPWVGLVTAAFFVAIFPGNINQYVEGIDAFGLDTDQARLTRLFFQPILILWALWSTRAWSLCTRGATSADGEDTKTVALSTLEAAHNLQEGKGS
jgi:uncharacterized membrane protein